MDIVLDKLENTTISPHDSENKSSNFDGLYKNWGRLGNQDERRKEILGVQKSNRNSHVDKCRGILELIHTVEQPTIFRTDYRSYYKPSIYVAGFNKVTSYKEVLMMSEWMIEKPFDFDTNWLVVPSPKGTRALVVACNGITRLYSKYGHLLYECRTALPGGNPCCRKTNVNCCVLDCLFQKKEKVLYVLDLLAWNSQPMTDGELEFRDYWIKTQLFELDDINGLNKKNHLNFRLLPKVPCDPENFNKFMMQTHFGDDITQLDGLLFFHKKAHYCSGETPLVGWLYPFMVPEVIGNHVTVNPLYNIQKPENYTNQADFIIQFNMKMEKRASKVNNRWKSTRDKTVSSDGAKTETETESMEAESVPNTADDEASNVTAKDPVPTKESLNAESTNSKDEKIPSSKDTDILNAMDADAPDSVKSVISAAMDTENADKEDENK